MMAPPGLPSGKALLEQPENAEHNLPPGLAQAPTRPPASCVPTGSSSRPPPPPVPTGASASSSSVGRPPPPSIPVPAQEDLEDDEYDVDEEAGAAEEDCPSERVPDNRVRTPKQAIFETHLTLEEAKAQHKAGLLVRGVLTVSTSRFSNAWVRPDGVKYRCKDKDIAIKGLCFRNRAVHRDVVFVKVLEHEAQEEGVESDSDDVGEGHSSGSEEVLLQGPLLQDRRRMRMGKVVAIADPKGRNEATVCTLHARQKRGSRDVDGQIVQQNDKLFLAKPTDKHRPWVLIPVNNATKGVLQIPGKLNPYMLWPIQIWKWDEHAKLPLGRLKGVCLGEAGEVEAEVKHALINNALDSHDVDFTSEMLDEVDELVKTSRLTFNEEVNKRVDLRRKRVFTIDPATAKDLDDAIHVDLDKARGEVEIGVHIADVAHYLKLGSAADIEAQRRTTSVYLIDRVLPMLPHALCNHLCSLAPNEPKLTFSVFFRLKLATGELVEEQGHEPRFQKTVINSCCRLNYDEVQDVLDATEIEEPVVYNNHTWAQLREDCLLLYDICGKVREDRLSNGALSITKTKMIFHSRESDDGVPTNWQLESHSASHWVIEELMLLANRCVAKHLALSELSTKGAVLRNHQSPDMDKMEEMVRLMKKNLSLQFWDARSAGRLYHSCQEMYRSYGETLGESVDFMVMRAGMMQARYFVFDGEEDPHHYALNFDHYTHFTSPIRRYPDVMVHRVLQALLGSEDEYQDVEAAGFQVEICNDKKQSSRKCQEQLDRAVFCIYLRKKREWFYTIGVVLSFKIGKKKGDFLVVVYCPELGKEKGVQLRPTAKVEETLYKEGVNDHITMPKTWKRYGQGCVDVQWDDGADPPGSVVNQRLQHLCCVPVVVVPTNTVPIDFAIFLVSPFHPKYEGVRRDITDAAAKGLEYTQTEEDGVDVVDQME